MTGEIYEAIRLQKLIEADWVKNSFLHKINSRPRRRRKRG